MARRGTRTLRSLRISCASMRQETLAMLEEVGKQSRRCWDKIQCCDLSMRRRWKLSKRVHLLNVRREAIEDVFLELCDMIVELNRALRAARRVDRATN